VKRRRRRGKHLESTKAGLNVKKKGQDEIRNLGRGWVVKSARRTVFRKGENQKLHKRSGRKMGGLLKLLEGWRKLKKKVRI